MPYSDTTPRYLTDILEPREKYTEDFLDLWPLGLDECQRFMSNFRYCLNGCGFCWDAPNTYSYNDSDKCPNCGKRAPWLAYHVDSPFDIEAR